MLASGSPSVERPSATGAHSVLLCQAGSILCALPLEYVLETMRPQPFEALSGTAPFIDGVSIIRGRPVPVVDLARLLGTGTEGVRTRLLVVRVGERRAALSVGSVIGVRALESSALSEMAPLSRGASPEMIKAVGSLDARLLLLLEASRILPDSSWASLEAGAQA